MALLSVGKSNTEIRDVNTTNMRKILVAAWMVFSTISCHQSTVAERESAAERVKEALTLELVQIHQRGYINGFSVAIVNENQLLYATGIGYGNSKTREPYTEQTIQNIGSISKTLIGIALLKAQEMGKLKLDDPINSYLPYAVNNPWFPEIPITIRHLATHTSTMLDSYRYFNQSYVLARDESSSDSMVYRALRNHGVTFKPAAAKIAPEEFLRKMLVPGGEYYGLENFSKYQPGERFEYSNVGATLAAVILEQAVGQSFDEFTTGHILMPLKMDASGWSFDAVSMEHHSRLYLEPELELPLYSLITYPEGGLLTNIHDLGTYLVELIRGYNGDGLILSKDSYQEIFRAQLTGENFAERPLDNPYADDYNYGIFMGFTPTGYIGHSGLEPGVSTYMFFNPKSNTGRVLITNTNFLTSVEGAEEFDAIWNVLGKYEHQLNQLLYRPKEGY